MRGFPEQVKVEIKRIPLNELPRDTQGVKDWLMELWTQKEERVKILKENPGKSGTKNGLILVNEERRSESKKFITLWLIISGEWWRKLY